MQPSAGSSLINAHLSRPDEFDSGHVSGSSSNTTKPTMATITGVLFESDESPTEVHLRSNGLQNGEDSPSKHGKPKDGTAPYVHKLSIVWTNVIIFAYLHLAALYGVYLLFTSTKLATIAFAVAMYYASALGITAGAHRLWSHRGFKANARLRLLLMLSNTMAYQNHVIEWTRDHRVHHKYSETDADPHNSNRGFFFAHVGWLLSRKHPEVIRKGEAIDISDVDNDPILAFQKRYYMILVPLLCFIMPTAVPYYFWGESLSVAWHVPAVLRYVLTLQVTWLINSAAHMWGSRPYDKSIAPADNHFGLTYAAVGEGWHNYHHVFPWDYKAAELGNHRANVTTAFIDFMARIGWAWDLKTVSSDAIKNRVLKTGDGSHAVWGWGDKDMSQEDYAMASIAHKDS